MFNFLPCKFSFKQAFKKYRDKYGEFDSNPYNMSLHRMEFNVKYQFGKYYKVIDVDTNKIIGGIFGFELDQKDVMKIAQFYLLDNYQSLGYGSSVLKYFIENRWGIENQSAADYIVAEKNLVIVWQS